MKQTDMKNKGFTLIEMLVVIAIIAILSGIILFSVGLYVNKAKDSSIAGNLGILPTAGETYYNIGNSYSGFCDPGNATGSVLKNVISQMPQNSAICGCATGNGCSLSNYNTWTSNANPAGVCCEAKGDGSAWVAYAQEFTDATKIYCVDSRGLQEDAAGDSTTLSNINSSFQCP